jgi:predicted metal-dependent hydrolase
MTPARFPTTIDESRHVPPPDVVSLGDFQYRLIRSVKRKKTISATFQSGVLVVRVPKGMSKREELEWVHKMRERLEGRNKRRPQHFDQDLQALGQELNRRHFSGELSFTMSWTEKQRSRWGSCTTLTGDIRIARDLTKMPPYVLEYVVVHELAHLLVPDHSSEFWALVARYPKTERARGYLQGFCHGKGNPDDGGDC